MSRIVIAAVVGAMTLPAVAQAGPAGRADSGASLIAALTPRHSCVPPKPHGFVKSLAASPNVSCRMVRRVLAVWNHQEFPPFSAAGFKWWEWRKYLRTEDLMYTLLHTSGHRSIYMVTLPYG